MTKFDINKLQDLAINQEYYGFDYCDNFMYTLSRLEIGHNRTIRFWMAQELYILLTQGPHALKKHRDDNNWWG
jgi:hypothetical protein